FEGSLGARRDLQHGRLRAHHRRQGERDAEACAEPKSHASIGMKTGTMTPLAAITAAQDANDTFRMMKHSLGPFGWRTLATGVENPKVLQPKRPRDHGPFAARGARCRRE